MINNKRDTELAGLLKSRWESLPEYLRKPNQVVGRHWVQCGFTMGPPQCSFGCSHCYLPTHANGAAFPDLSNMKEQIDRNRELLGAGGNIQITGGDLVDAYLGQGRGDELVDLVAYARERQLVPMLMTHGQGLFDNPDYLIELVVNGGLRKLSCHIDITQAGRPGFPVKRLVRENQLNPVRDQLVRLVLDARERTGKRVTAAQTVTVSSRNLDSLVDILDWVASTPENLDVTRTIGFQTEAQVGRTLDHEHWVTPQQVWARICESLGQAIVGDHLLFGHPDCTSKVTVLIRSKDHRIVNLTPGGTESAAFWSRLLEAYSGRYMGPPGEIRGHLRRGMVALTNPRLVQSALGMLFHLNRQHGLSIGLAGSYLAGKAKGLNIVMHNFIGAAEVLKPTKENTRERLAACSFRGAILVDGKWEAVPMCRVNAEIRPELYRNIRKKVLNNDPAVAQSIPTSTVKPPLSSRVIDPSATA